MSWYTVYFLQCRGRAPSTATLSTAPTRRSVRGTCCMRRAACAPWPQWHQHRHRAPELVSSAVRRHLRLGAQPSPTDCASTSVRILRSFAAGTATGYVRLLVQCLRGSGGACRRPRRMRHQPVRHFVRATSTRASWCPRGPTPAPRATSSDTVSTRSRLSSQSSTWAPAPPFIQLTLCGRLRRRPVARPQCHHGVHARRGGHRLRRGGHRLRTRRVA